MMILAAPWDMHSDEFRKSANDEESIVTFDHGILTKEAGVWAIKFKGHVGNAEKVLADLEPA
jgi:hypothetical protein